MSRHETSEIRPSATLTEFLQRIGLHRRLQRRRRFFREKKNQVFRRALNSIFFNRAVYDASFAIKGGNSILSIFHADKNYDGRFAAHATWHLARRFPDTSSKQRDNS